MFLASSQLTTAFIDTAIVLCVHVYVGIYLCDSMLAFWVEGACFSLFGYIYVYFGDQIIKRGMTGIPGA